jgi:large subunit ribosomal protein L35
VGRRAQAASKRFKVTGTGKLMARKAGKQHFNEKKSSEDLM